MAREGAKQCTNCELRVDSCRKLLRLFEREQVRIVELAFNLATQLVFVCEDCARQYLSTLPADIRREFFAYLHDYLQPVDFMPPPEHFLAGKPSEELIRSKKQELRPKYVQLYETVRQMS